MRYFELTYPFVTCCECNTIIDTLRLKTNVSCGCHNLRVALLHDCVEVTVISLRKAYRVFKFEPVKKDKSVNDEPVKSHRATGGDGTLSLFPGI